LQEFSWLCQAELLELLWFNYEKEAANFSATSAEGLEIAVA
jgi:hypothetical protein